MAQIQAQDQAARQRIYQNRLWMTLSVQLRIPGSDQLRRILTANYQEAIQPLHELEQQFKQRIDEIPTEAQRTAAEQRLLSKLAASGLATTAEAQP